MATTDLNRVKKSDLLVRESVAFVTKRKRVNIRIYLCIDGHWYMTITFFFISVTVDISDIISLTKKEN